MLTSPSGYIRSPRFGIADYPSNDVCYWQIIGMQRSRIRLIFETLDISQSSIDCATSDDLLLIFDGPDESSSLVGTYCGRHDYPPVILSRNTGYIKFRSSGGVSSRGFSIRYELIDAGNSVVDMPPAPVAGTNSTRCGGQKHHLYENNGLIFTPGFENGAYPLSDQCFWTITTAAVNQRVRLSFRSFSVGVRAVDKSCSNDYVEIYDGPNDQADLIARLCGAYQRFSVLPPPLESSSRYMALKFVSRDVPSYSRGFAAFYTFIRKF